MFQSFLWHRANPVPHPSTDLMCDFCFVFFTRPVLWMKMLPPPPVTSSLSSFSPQPKAKNLREEQMLKSIKVSYISSARLWNVVELKMLCVGDGFGDPRLLSDVSSVFLLVCALRTEMNFCVDVIQVALCWSRLWWCLIVAGFIVTRTNVFHLELQSETQTAHSRTLSSLSSQTSLAPRGLCTQTVSSFKDVQ